MGETRKPLWRRIADTLRAEIIAGKYDKSGQLPSDNQLVRRYATTRATVIKAMAELETAGFIVRRIGAGTFLKPQQEAKNCYVATLIAGLGDSGFFVPICAQIAQSARSYGLNLIWGADSEFNAFGSEASIDHLIEHYQRQNIRGVFFAPDDDLGDGSAAERNRSVAARLAKAGIAVVLIDRDVETYPVASPYDFVGIDNGTNRIKFNYLLRFNVFCLYFVIIGIGIFGGIIAVRTDRGPSNIFKSAIGIVASINDVFAIGNVVPKHNNVINVLPNCSYNGILCGGFVSFA
jgi:hypothetical protein